MYWPLDVMVPGPALASPPETAHVTLAAPPPESVAESCSTGVPEELELLQPVQLVSIVAVVGETEKVPLEEPPVVVTPPPQPARTSRAGAANAAKLRADHRCSLLAWARRFVECEE